MRIGVSGRRYVPGMPTRARPAIVTLRMSASLRNPLHEVENPAFFVQWARARDA